MPWRKRPCIMERTGSTEHSLDRSGSWFTSATQSMCKHSKSAWDYSHLCPCGKMDSRKLRQCDKEIKTLRSGSGWLELRVDYSRSGSGEHTMMTQGQLEQSDKYAENGLSNISILPWTDPLAGNTLNVCPRTWMNSSNLTLSEWFDIFTQVNSEPAGSHDMQRDADGLLPGSTCFRMNPAIAMNPALCTYHQVCNTKTPGLVSHRGQQAPGERHRGAQWPVCALDPAGHRAYLSAHVSAGPGGRQITQQPTKLQKQITL